MALAITHTFDDMLKVGNLDSPVIVINNFLQNPDEVRELALGAEYKQDKVYPGKRSPQETIEGPMLKVFERFIGKPILKMESVFQIQPVDYEEKSFIHGDPSEWAAVLYLNKDCDGKPGTNFYRHKETGIERLKIGVDLMFAAIENGVQPDEILAPLIRDRFDPSKWDVTLSVPVKYNRLVLYSARLYHRNAVTWGTDIHDARLVQSFFIFTEPLDGRERAGILYTNEDPVGSV